MQNLFLFNNIKDSIRLLLLPVPHGGSGMNTGGAHNYFTRHIFSMSQTTLAQVLVRVSPSMCHALVCLIFLRLSTLHSSFVSPFFYFILLIFHFLFCVDVAAARSPVHFAG